MSYSSGTRTLLGEVAGWVVVAGILSVFAINYEAVRLGVAQMMDVELSSSGPEDGKAPGASEPARSGYSVELTAGDNGHFHTEAEVNGRGVPVMVDTGATMVVLTYEDAETAGIFLRDSDYTHTASTANGTSRIAPVSLDRVSIGDITVRNVQAAVAERGRLQTTLLGMSFLSRLDRVDMRSGKLLLQD